MKKLLIGFLVVAVMLLAVGCLQPASPPVYTPSPEPPAPYVPPAPPTPPAVPGGETVNNGGTTPILPGKPPPEDMTWISPGKVKVANFYPGARAEYPLLVHNGNDTTASFTVYYRYPDHVDSDYVKPSEEVQDWVIVADPTPVLMPRETREILIILDMPSNAEVFASNWEFWIGVMDTTQTGMVKTELCCRWLVSMR